MRWVYSFLAVLLLALATLSGAADYRLTIDGSPADLVAGRVLVLYGSGLKKGDRVVELQYGAVGSERACQVSAVEKSDAGVMVSDFGAAKGFGGKIVSASGRPSGKSVRASVMLVGTAVDKQDSGAGFFGSVFGFFTSLPGLFILGGVAVVVAIWFVLKGRMSTDTIHVPSSRRRTFEDALRDIADRLDQIDEAQKDLVKKPPMLRSFKAQIDGFQDKLDRIEALSVALEAGQTKNQTALSTLDHAMKDLRVRTDKADQSLSDLTATTASTGQALDELSVKTAEAERTSRESGARSAELMMKLAKQEEELASRLFAIQGSQQKVEGAVSDTQQTLKGLAEKTGKLEQLSDEQRAEFLKSLGVLDSRLEELAGRETPDSSAELDALRKQLDGLSAAQAQLAQNLAEFAEAANSSDDEALQLALQDLAEKQSAAEERLAAGLAKLESLDVRTDVKALSAAQAGFADALGKVSAAVANFKDEGLRDQLEALAKDHAASQGRLGELFEKIASLEKQGEQHASSLEKRFEDVAARLDQRSETVLSIEKQLKEQSSNSIDFVDFTPAIGDLRAQVQSLAADQARAGQSLSALGEALASLQKDSGQSAELLEKKMGEVVSRLDQRAEAALTVENSGSSGVEVIDFTPAIGDLRHEVHALAADQEKTSQTMGNLLAAINKLSAESSQSTAAVERLRLEVGAKLQAHAEAPAKPEPKAKLEVVECSPEPLPETVTEATLEPEMVALEELVEIPAAEQSKTQETDDSEDTNSRWFCQGGSSARHWSVQTQQALDFEESEEELKPLTPTETPPIDFGLGGLLYSNGKVVYAHGDTLRGFWPGKGASSAPLKSPLGGEAWRVACLDGRAFCIQSDQVEIVSLSTWVGQAKFSGQYLDQVCTDKRWAGLLSQDGSLAVDFREPTGKQAGTPICVEAKVADAKAFVAEGEDVFVATKDARIFRVSEGGSELLATDLPKGIQLLSLSLYKHSLLAVAQVAGEVYAFLCDKSGAMQKQVALGFAQAYAHPVVIGDRMYLIGSEEATGEMSHLLIVNLKKMETAGQMALPGDRVASFAGIHSGNKHALLITLLEEGSASGRVVQFDPKSGAAMTICRVNHPRIEVIAADGKIVVATGSSYQNMIRVFDPASAAKTQKEAA
ncbi:MAG: hypothetical protein WAO58_12975 [Fimbriimonadaceae bacterium]